MSVFSKILEKLGLNKDKDKPAVVPPAPAPAAVAPKPVAAAPAVPPVAQAPTPKPSAVPSSMPAAAMQSPAAPAPAPKPVAISEVDVVKQLEAKAKGTGLNWKQSISDLLCLLDIDNSREARNELAQELGCPPEFMTDSAKMNTWLHKTVLKKIAENGGNIPKELLD